MLWFINTKLVGTGTGYDGTREQMDWVEWGQG